MFLLKSFITKDDERAMSSLRMNYIEYASLNNDARQALNAEYKTASNVDSFERDLINNATFLKANKPKVKSLIKRK